MTKSEIIAALRPFADFTDTRGLIPDHYVITQGSSLAKTQLTMGDCRRALKIVDQLQGSMAYEEYEE